MEKLLQLLNEFKKDESFQFIGYNEKYWVFNTDLNIGGDNSLPEETIVSKKFWFIQWLVENDKVGILWDVIKDIQYWGHWQIENVDTYDKYDSLLMLLAINDDPIKFLVSILK